ncbi:MAG: FAD-dependent oxidoreductase, partial [Hyphomicrobiaceae bacterium]|nr:FAD-dependent oxidoreductase [Hyphomicrobiaceae bacterium]
QALEEAGVVALDLSGGSNESPQLSRYCIQPPSLPRRCLEPFARPLKDAVGIPVIIAGRIVSPEDAEGVLEAGSADFISLGRALIADPHWTLKALGEVSAPIRPCISCNVCFERLTLERDVACVQNPMVGTEFEELLRLEPQLAGQSPARGQRRRVLVIGAGVAGLEAARMAGGLGHIVEVWEKESQAGGQVPLAVAAPDKEDVAGVFTYRAQALSQLDVRARMGVVPNAGAIRAFAPDLVIVATGARPRRLALDLPIPVVQAWDVVRDATLLPAGAAVTIVGGGMVGIEAADLLAAHGCRVTVIETRDTLAPEMARNNRLEILERLKRQGVVLHTSTTIRGTAGGRLRLASSAGESEFAPGDAVVLAIGPEPERSVLAEVEASGAPFVLVGDCNRPGDFMTAIRDASMVGQALLLNGTGRQLNA